jgi:N-acetylglucosaminyl-diphospho-decaprenol L-rhamnosyltransferase
VRTAVAATFAWMSDRAVVHAVVVSYRSADTLRGCVEPLAAMPNVHVTVVDNASPDDSLEAIAGLDVDVVRSQRNGGFGYGCNIGAARADAPYLLFLNPDARIEPADLDELVGALERHPEAGVVGPRILEPGSELAFSRRRFPRLCSTYAQALFLHRARPLAPWADELVRDVAAYRRSGTSDWISGACMLVRRTAFEAIGGFDERFFLYCEDTDLCAELWRAGWEVRFEAGAEVHHVGGASSGTGETQAIAARSRVIYARKHRGRSGALLERLGIALGELTHAATSLTRPASRRGHLAAARAVLAPRT